MLSAIKMEAARISLSVRRPYDFCLKMTAVAIIGLLFVFIWPMFSSPSLILRTDSFEDVTRPGFVSDLPHAQIDSGTREPYTPPATENFQKHKHDSEEKEEEKESRKFSRRSKNDSQKEEESEDEIPRKEEEVPGESVKEDILDPEQEEEEVGGDEDSGEISEGDVIKKLKKKTMVPLLDAKEQYNWKPCHTKAKHNYIPCVDIGGSNARLASYRYRERRCPAAPVMCVVPSPRGGYRTPVKWPESKWKILYGNMAHSKLDALVKVSKWMHESKGYLIFQENQSESEGDALHYLESIEEMVPDIEWGKNIRVVLDIGCGSIGFGASLLKKSVLILSVGLQNDLTDLAQVALERGFPAVICPFGSSRLPFPSNSFDVIHCGGCNINWHSNGGKLLLEMNRIVRPSGYFILSKQHDTIEDTEAVASLTASICWNVLAHKVVDVIEMDVKIYQKPDSNDIYELRRKKTPILCEENDNPDAAWYVPIKTCLNPIPSSIEQHGAEWPEEWPKRLGSYPDWLNDKERVIADTNHWKAVVDGSYLFGMGVNWSSVRNVMDMRAGYGGFAAALENRSVWVMNVIPVHAPDTLPFIYERGLLGIYHDWCEPFPTYPRTYDLLHADHVFARLKNRCKKPIAIVVEMDRMLRHGGWAIVRDKVETLDGVERALKSLHFEIYMRFAQGKEGILCARKTSWRP